MLLGWTSDCAAAWRQKPQQQQKNPTKPQISREEQGRERNKKPGNVLVNFVWLLEPLPDTLASHLNLTHFSFAFCSSPLREHKAEEVGIYGLEPFPSVSPCYFQTFFYLERKAFYFFSLLFIHYTYFPAKIACLCSSPPPPL